MTSKDSKPAKVVISFACLLIIILGSVAIAPSYGYLNKNQPTSLYIVVSPSSIHAKVNSTTNYTISTFENSTFANVSLNITLHFFYNNSKSFVLNINYTPIFTGKYQFYYKANMTGLGVFTVNAHYKGDFSNATASIYVSNNQVINPSYSLIGYVLPNSNLVPGGNVSVQGYVYYNSNLTTLPPYSSLSVLFAPTYYSINPDYTAIDSNIKNIGNVYWVNFSIPSNLNESGIFYLSLSGEFGITNAYLFTYNFYDIWAKYIGNTMYLGAYLNNGSALYNATVTAYLSNGMNNAINYYTGKTNGNGVFSFNVTNSTVSKIYGFVDANGYRQGFSISLLGKIPIINFEKDAYDYANNVYMLYTQTINTQLSGIAYFNNSILSNTNIYYMVYLSTISSSQQNFIASGKMQTNSNGLFNLPLNINLDNSNILKSDVMYTVTVILRAYVSDKICNQDYDKDLNGTYFTTLYTTNYLYNPYIKNMSLSSYSISNGFIKFTLKAPPVFLAPLNISISNLGMQTPLVGNSVGIKPNGTALVSSPMILPLNNTYTATIYVPPMFKSSSYNIFAYGIAIEGDANNVHAVLLTWNDVISQNATSNNIQNILDSGTISLMAIAGALMIAILILVVIGKKKQLMDKYKQQETANADNLNNMQQNTGQSDEYQQPPLQP